MPRIPRIALALALALALAAAACGPSRYVKRNADFAGLKTVAILPFDNLTTDRLCAERLNRIFLTELLNRRAFQVVEPGQVMRAVRGQGFDAASLTPDDIKRLGKALNAQALVVGSVLEFEEARAGNGARVKLQFRLIETETAATVWSVTRSQSGLGFGARLFGLEGASATDIAEQLVKDEVSRLAG